MKDRAMMGPALHERHEDDLYETPAWVTELLLDKLGWEEQVWEPACGRGAIAKVLTAHGIDVAATDLREYGYGASGLDFLTCTDETSRDIITNPPYSKAAEFVRRALMLTEKNKGAVAMLMRNDWDAAASRDDLLKPGSRYWGKIVITRRIRWIEGTTGQPRHNHAWFIWGGARYEWPRILRGR
jgi:hypothetical protein